MSLQAGERCLGWGTDGGKPARWNCCRRCRASTGAGAGAGVVESVQEPQTCPHPDLLQALMHQGLRGQTEINLLLFFFPQFVLAQDLATKGLKKKGVSKCLGHLQHYTVSKRMQLNMFLVNCLDSAVKSQILYKCHFIIVYLFESKHLQRTQTHILLLSSCPAGLSPSLHLPRSAAASDREQLVHQESTTLRK